MPHKSVLIVDDDDRLQKMLTCYFMTKSFNVLSAKDGFAAIKILETLRPDLIIFDLAMPDMDGFELCSLIKKDAIWKDIPIMAISALSAADNRKRILSLGVVDYFEKPFEVRKLMDRVAELLDLNEGAFRRSSGVLNFKGGEV